MAAILCALARLGKSGTALAVLALISAAFVPIFAGVYFPMANWTHEFRARHPRETIAQILSREGIIAVVQLTCLAGLITLGFVGYVLYFYLLQVLWRVA